MPCPTFGGFRTVQDGQSMRTVVALVAQQRHELSHALEKARTAIRQGVVIGIVAVIACSGQQ